MIGGYCPGCDCDLPIERAVEGLRVTCSQCGAYLEVIHVSPLELDWADDDKDDEVDEDVY